MANTIFYDLVYSPDDNGYYCQTYVSTGEEVFTTDIWPTSKQAEMEVKAKYPEAQLLNKFLG